MKKNKLLSLFLCNLLLLSSCSQESDTAADEMRLENYIGDITLQNSNEDKPVVLGTRLVTGDSIETMLESNAFVLLDKSKVLRVNETSQIEITQNEKQYDIHLSKGTLFFNVTSTLTEEESLAFHTNNVVTGVRGTSGIIHFDPENQRTQIVVLTGTVTGTTVSEEQTIQSGEMALVETLEDGTVTMTIYQLEDEHQLYYFSDTFIDDLQGDLSFEGESVPLSDMVRISSNPNTWVDLYIELLQNAYVEQEAFSAEHYGDVYNYMLHDMNNDGVPELFLKKGTWSGYVDIYSEGSGGDLLGFQEVYLYNDGPVAANNGSATGISLRGEGIVTVLPNVVYDANDIFQGFDGLVVYERYLEDDQLKVEERIDSSGNTNIVMSETPEGYGTALPNTWYNIDDLTIFDLWKHPDYRRYASVIQQLATPEEPPYDGLGFHMYGTNGLSCAVNFYDIDQDGKNELLFYSNQENLMAVFSVIDEEIEMVGYGTYRNALNMQVNGVMSTSGSGSAWSNGTSFFRLVDGKVESLASVWNDYDFEAEQQTSDYVPDQATFDSYKDVAYYTPDTRYVIYGEAWW